MDGTNYDALSSNVTFTSGSSDADEECVNITIRVDGVFISDETFTLMLTTSDPDVIIQNNVTAITIMDTDGW